MKPKKGWLFDLDGTLLPLHVDEFIPRYVASLCGHVAEILEPEQFRRCLLMATARMIEDQQGHLTNEDVFWHHFRHCLGAEIATEVAPVVEDYYQRIYPELGQAYRADRWARRVLQSVIERGGRLVLATNPVFPLRAIRERMRWAGIADIPFELVTSYEKMHSCKPCVRYYEEILGVLGWAAEDCIMVGNDMQEDLVPAGKLGMDTYLVEGMVIDRSSRRMTVPGPRGRLQELAHELEKGVRC